MGKTSARFLKMCRRFIANVSLFLLDVWGRDENHEVKALNRATVHRLNFDKNNLLIGFLSDKLPDDFNKVLTVFISFIFADTTYFAEGLYRRRA